MPSAPARSYPRLAANAVFFERWILSLVYLFLAGWILLGADGLWRGAGLSTSEVVQDVIMFQVQLFIGVTLLLFARPPAVAPQNLREIFVPLATAFFFLAYNVIPALPPWWQRSLWPGRPPALETVAVVLGCFIGPAISLWGALWLGRSFGIFVFVRQVVLGGPYRFVRHPIYLGYICVYVSLVLDWPSRARLVIAAIHISLFVWRARLEEARLAEHSAEYRERMKHTGFIFPRLGW